MQQAYPRAYGCRLVVGISCVDPEARPILSRLELKSFAPIDPSAYEVTLAWEKEALDRNYPEIA